MNDKPLKDTYELIDFAESTRKAVLKNSFNAGSEILSLRFNTDDSLLALGTLSGHLQVYHVQTNTRKSNIDIGGNNPTPCTCIRWRPSSQNDSDPTTVTTGDGLGNIIEWNTHFGRELQRISEKDNQIMCMDYNETGQFLATGGKDSTIRVYDESSKVAEYQLIGQSYQSSQSHSNRVFSLKFLPDNMNVLISGSWDQNINIWDLRSKKCAGSFIGGKISGDSVDYKKGQILVGANSACDQLKIFDLKERKLIKQVDYDKSVRENGAFIFGAQFSKSSNDSFAVCSSGKNEVKLFDTTPTNSPIAAISKFPKGLYTLDYANHSNKLATGGADGIAVVLSTAPKAS